MNTIKPKKSWVTGTVVRHMSSCTPGHRTFLATLWRDPDSAGLFFEEVFPVLAVRTQVVDYYEKLSDRDCEANVEGVTGDDLEERGFRFTVTETEDKLIVVDDEGYLSIHDDSYMTRDHSKREVIVMPWPYDEARDKNYFRAAFERMKSSYREEDKRNEERAAKI